MDVTYDIEGNPLPSTAPAGVSAPSSSDSSSWLSGLGSLFSGAGAGIAAVIKADQPPATPYRPYYTATGVNQSVAQPFGAGSLFNSPIFLLLLGLGAYYLIKKRG